MIPVAPNRCLASPCTRSAPSSRPIAMRRRNISDAGRGKSIWMTQAAWCWLLWPIDRGRSHDSPSRAGPPRSPEAADALLLPDGHRLRRGRHGLQHLHPLHRLLADLCHRRGSFQRAGDARYAAGQGQVRRNPRQAGRRLGDGRRGGRRPGHRHVRPRRPSQGARPASQPRRHGRVLPGQRPAAVAGGRRPLGRLRDCHRRRRQADRRRGRTVRRRILERQHRLSLRQSRRLPHRTRLQPVSCPQEPLARRADGAPQRQRSGDTWGSITDWRCSRARCGTGSSSSTTSATCEWAPTSSPVGPST